MATLVSEKITLALNTSVVDLQSKRIPNFQRPSPSYLEEIVNGSLTLSPVPSNVFAISEVDGSFYVEPGGTNLITYNLDLSQPVWEKGSNVNVTSDAAPAPDASFLADRVTWLPSSLGGSPQTLRRSVDLRPGRTYQFWALLQPISGSAGSKDVFRIRSADETTTFLSKPLGELNGHQGQYRIFHTEFVAPGVDIEVPSLATPDGLVAVTASTFTIALQGVTVDQLAGADVSFGGTERYKVSGHSATDGSGNVLVTVDSTALISDGVDTNSVASFSDPEDAASWLEFYCESLFAVNFGGVFLEQGDFRTSAIYQRSELKTRADTLFEFQPKDNVLAGQTNFAIYFDLKEWRGDGGVLDFGDLSLEIEDSILRVTAGATTVTDTEQLPLSCRVLLILNPETASISLFVNGILKGKQSLSGFTPSLNPFVIPSEGVRRFQELVIFGEALTDGTPSLGEVAQREAAVVFAASPIPASMISGHSSRLVLPTVTIPAAPSDTASTSITAIDTVTKTITVSNISGFANGDKVSVSRGAERSTIIFANITEAPSGSSIVLDTVAGVSAGDNLIKPSDQKIGRVFQRFPIFPAFAPQSILAVDLGEKRLTVSSALSFSAGERVLIETTKSQDVVEAIIESRDTENNYLYLSSVVGIEVGHLASQPFSETTIPPSSYVADILEEVSGVQIEQKATNGIVLTNNAPFDVSVTPYIMVIG